MKMGRNSIFGCVLVFCFHAKSGTTNNHRNGSSDISYKSPIKCDLNDFEKSPGADLRFSGGGRGFSKKNVESLVNLFSGRPN